MVLDQECWASSMTHGWENLILHGKTSIAQKNQVAMGHKSLWSKFGCRLHSPWRMLMTNGRLLMGFYCVPSQSSLRERERERICWWTISQWSYWGTASQKKKKKRVIEVLFICYLWMLKWWSRDMVVLDRFSHIFLEKLFHGSFG